MNQQEIIRLAALHADYSFSQVSWKDLAPEEKEIFETPGQWRKYCQACSDTLRELADELAGRLR